MATVEQIEENLRLLTEHADRFFAGTITKEQLFELMQIAFGSLSDLFRGLADRGALKAEDAATYQWATTIIAAIIRTLEIEPKYGSPILEEQLRRNFRAKLKGAPIKEISRIMTQ